MYLPNVTLCAIDINPKLAARALEISQANCTFGDVILFTDQFTSGMFRVKPLNLPSLKWPNWYAEFCLTKLAHHIETEFALKIEYDGYVLNAELWEDEFTAYDYVGARWPWLPTGSSVGNGGFSLRSKRLMEVTAAIDYPEPLLRDDTFICHTIRPLLDKGGITFATPELADIFAHERTKPTIPTFGFHGLYNFPKYVSDAEMLYLANLFPTEVTKKSEYHELIHIYRIIDKPHIADALEARLKRIG